MNRSVFKSSLGDQTDQKSAWAQKKIIKDKQKLIFQFLLTIKIGI